jgi:hypothetical protein
LKNHFRNVFSFFIIWRKNVKSKTKLIQNDKRSQNKFGVNVLCTCVLVYKNSFSRSIDGRL